MKSHPCNVTCGTFGVMVALCLLGVATGFGGHAGLAVAVCGRWGASKVSISGRILLRILLILLVLLILLIVVGWIGGAVGCAGC